MSYILVTYGYNQFSLFNIKTSTPTLIDKIKEVSFQSIVQKLQARDKSIIKELESFVIEEEKLNKLKAATEQELQVEEDKYQEALKQLEAKKKKEELEQKKKEAEAKEAKGKGKKEEKKTQEKKKAGKKEEKKTEEPGVDDKPINDLKEKLNKIAEDLNTLSNNKVINNDKKSKVQQFLSIFSKKYKDRVNIKIDLVDSKGEKVNINTRGDGLANEYLIEKTCYELHSFNIPQKNEDESKDSKPKAERLSAINDLIQLLNDQRMVTQLFIPNIETVMELNSFNIPQKNEEDNKDSKKNTKKDFKKDDKKKENKENKDNKDNKDNKEEPKEIELVLEPVKIDGYCFRTIKEDQNMDETEKTTGKDKKGAKKK